LKYLKLWNRQRKCRQREGADNRVGPTGACLEEFEVSGYTVKEFCEISDLNEATFYSWLRKYRHRTDVEIEGFAAVEVLPAMTPAQPALFAEVGLIRLYKEVSAEYLKYLLS